MTTIVRPANIADATAIGEAHVKAWLAAYVGLMPDDYLDSLSAEQRAEDWRAALGRDPSPRSIRLVADQRGALVGFALAGPAMIGDDENLGEVYALNVHPDHWGSGAGTKLLDAAVRFLSKEGFTDAILWVHPDNWRARNFYEARGWTDDGIVRREVVMDVEVPEARYSLSLDRQDRSTNRV